MLGSVAAMDASLDNDYGSTKGPNAAANLALGLFVGDPTAGGVELDGTGGYARATAPNNGTTWPTPAAGGYKTAAPSAFVFPTSTDAWQDSATHWVLFDADTGDAWDSGRLADEVSVEVAGVSESVIPTVFYDDEGTL